MMDVEDEHNHMRAVLAYVTRLVNQELLLQNEYLAGRVEDGREYVTPERRPVSHPRSSNRTCRFPASGFPTGFTVDSRTRLHLD